MDMNMDKDIDMNMNMDTHVFYCFYWIPLHRTVLHFVVHAVHIANSFVVAHLVVHVWDYDYDDNDNDGAPSFCIYRILLHFEFFGR